MHEPMAAAAARFSSPPKLGAIPQRGSEQGHLFPLKVGTGEQQDFAGSRNGAAEIQFQLKRDFFFSREREIEVSNKSSRVSRSGSQNISEKEKAMKNKFHPLCSRCGGVGTGSLKFLPTQTCLDSVIF